MIKKINYILLPLLAICFLIFSSTYASARNVYGNKYATIIVDHKDGKILYSRGASLERYPASLTKIMTLYLVFEDIKKGKIKLSTKLRASRRAVRQPPSKIGLGIGEKISVEKAIRALVVKSANDVAVTVAENLGGSERNFARRMTATAKRLGMKKTRFKNASGLPNFAQVTTAYDMAILASRMISDFPEYYHYFSLRTFKYQGHVFRSHNKLLGRYKGADGLKTGYIRASGFNLVTSVKRGNDRLIGVVFGGVSGSRRDLHMKYILNKGFRVAQHLRTRPLDKTNTREYAKLHNKKFKKTYVATATKQIEQGSAESKVGDWAIQVGAYGNKNIARKQTQKALSLLPDKMDLTVEILQVKKARRSLFRARLQGFSKTEAKMVCSSIRSETNMPCIVVKK